MGNVIMCAGGGGVKSDDVTATLANILEGKTALTSDSDDDIGTGTMPECGAITLAPTGNNTLTSGEGHYDSVTADGSLQTQTFTTGAPFAGGATVNSVSLS